MTVISREKKDIYTYLSWNEVDSTMSTSLTKPLEPSNNYGTLHVDTKTWHIQTRVFLAEGYIYLTSWQTNHISF